MGAVRRAEQRDGQERPVVILDRVLMALDHLDPAEQAAVWQALEELQQLPPGAPIDPRLRRIPLDEPVYTLRAAPEVVLFVQLVPHGPVVLEAIVRPETLRQFSVPAATLERA